MVFNPSGFKRSLRYLVELPVTDELKGSNSIRLATQDYRIPVQKGSNGNLLFPIESLPSTGYTCVYLSPMVVQKKMPQGLTPQDKYVFGNRRISVTIEQNKGWAITGITVSSPMPPVLLWAKRGNLLKTPSNSTKEPRVSPPVSRIWPG